MANLGEEALIPAFSLTQSLRRAGIKADSDHLKRSLKAQLRFADKLGVKMLIFVGGEELSRGNVKVKDMVTGGENELPLGDAIAYITEKLTVNGEDVRNG